MIVVYDFDKTLTYKDTLFGFFTSFSKNPLKIFLYFTAMVFSKFKLISNDSLKDFGVKLFISKKSRDEVQKRAKEYAKKIKTNRVYDEIKLDKNKKIYIVSASFEEYLNYLFDKDIKIIASKLRYKDDKVTGLLYNCYSKRKIEALKNENILKIDRFFTDSYSDLPLAKISKEIVVVKGDEQKVCKNIEEFIRYVKR